MATKTVNVTVSGSDVTVTISASNYTGIAQVSCTPKGATSSAQSKKEIGDEFAPATFTFGNLADGAYDVTVVCSKQTFIQEATVPQTASVAFNFTSTHPDQPPWHGGQGKSDK